ncbi:meiotic recombination protein REC114-like [Ptychodera flava]|uniref:meiotic recombination protein REC114-like n=1 Tax=Ptychodera flava TaxID=63121 RepID=UPI00396A38FD
MVHCNFLECYSPTMHANITFWTGVFWLVNIKGITNTSFTLQHIESSDLILVLLESKNMILSSGNTIHENYSLLNASDWMRAISKGDSVLFACRIKNEIRRFRIQFKKTSHKTAIQHCHDCSHVLATYIRVKNANLATSSADGDSQLEDLNKETDTGETCRLNGEVSLQDVAKAVTVPGSFNLPIAYQHCNIQIPKEKLQALLRLCLTDADFPAFVGCVEKELQEIINES